MPSQILQQGGSQNLQQGGSQLLHHGGDVNLPPRSTTKLKSQEGSRTGRKQSALTMEPAMEGLSPTALDRGFKK
jgi:hypothetical protein